MASNQRLCTPRDMPAGLAHLHQRKFYHRDLKLENVAVSEGNIVKLIDFGSSTSVAAGTTASATADEEEGGGDGGAVAQERTQVISLSQKAHTRAPEVVLGQSVKGTPEEQEKVRRIHMCAHMLAAARHANTLTRNLRGCSSMCGALASSCSGWCLVTRPSASRRPTKQLSTNCVPSYLRLFLRDMLVTLADTSEDCVCRNAGLTNSTSIAG